LFVLFDVVIFLYPWAINFKELGNGRHGQNGHIYGSPFVGFSTSSKESARMGIRNYYKH
jgi:NADH:ubiquinone oxidoreductase subunit 3 (subunit A)